MGSCCISAKKKLELFNTYSKIFDSFDFRLSPSDEFTFIQRSSRELSFGYESEDYLKQIYSGYRNFLLKCCVEFFIRRDLNTRKVLIAPFQAPPLVDEIWQLAILYTEKYKELCKALVGRTIYRAPSKRLVGLTETFKPVWRFYDSSYWRYDRNFTVWVKTSQIQDFFSRCYEYFFSLRKGNGIRIRFLKIRKHLTALSKFLEMSHSQKNYSRWNSQIPSSHVYYNGTIRDNPGDILKKVVSKLPLVLKDLVNQKYCTGEYTDLYLQEYSRFMTLLYFTNTSLTPSEEVDQVWHIHQSLSFEYEKFCIGVYGKIINHSPTTGGHLEDQKYKAYYFYTIEFYSFIFRETPVIALWPPTELRFSPGYYQGNWISLYRLFTCIARVVFVLKGSHPQNLQREIASAYYNWQGQHIFKKQVFYINLQRPGKERNSNQMNFLFWTSYRVSGTGGKGKREGDDDEDDEEQGSQYDGGSCSGDTPDPNDVDSPASVGSVNSAGNSPGGSYGGYSGNSGGDAGYSGGGGDAGCSGGGGDAGCSGGGGDAGCSGGGGDAGCSGGGGCSGD
jgi:hypothetical protein